MLAAGIWVGEDAIVSRWARAARRPGWPRLPRARRAAPSRPWRRSLEGQPALTRGPPRAALGVA
jgi:hypothetical protein